MTTLHLLNESPFISNQLSNALLFASADDALLLTGDAVYSLQANTVPYQQLQQSPSLALYALEEDILARSIQITLDDVKIIDYQQFVELCTTYSKITSWL